MKKEKITISLDKGLLESVDNKVDGIIIRSRSQAIEFYLNKGLKDEEVTDAVIIIRGSDQDILLTEIKGKTLLEKHTELLKNSGIKSIFILTQKTSKTKELLKAARSALMPVRVIDRTARGNAEALYKIKELLNSPFVVISGDVFIDFSLKEMIRAHKKNNKIATMGLITRAQTKEFGEAVLEGSAIVEFAEKTENTKSHAVNSGIYVFNREIFQYLENRKSLEREVFPSLAEEKQLSGFFTHGEYLNFKRHKNGAKKADN